jgi:hypothetical protein
MAFEDETWLIETGDIVIAKMARSDLSSLTNTERAIYCFWVIDYSVRNSGTLGEIEGLYSNALSELNQFARENHCVRLSLISDPVSATDEEQFCEDFYRFFEPACIEIRALYERT